jgi:serine/threonine-protein kinase
MSTEVTPSPVHYRLLSEHFQACADLSEEEREEYLSGPSVGDLSLREDLRSLLRYHAHPAETPASPRAAAPQELRASRARPRKQFLIPFLILGATATVLPLLMRFCCLTPLETSTREEATRRLQQLLDDRVAAIRSWASRRKDLARSALEDPAFVSRIAALAGSAQTAERVAGVLRTGPSDAPVCRRMAQPPEGIGDLGYCIVDPAGFVLCSSIESTVGHPLAPESASCLRGLALGEWTLSRPYPDRQLGLTLDPEIPRPVMLVGGPIRGPQGQVLAYGAFFFSPEAEFYELLSCPGPAEFLAFDEKGLLLNNLKDSGPLLASGLLAAPSPNQTALRVRLRDPGQELRAASGPPGSAGSWAPTRMCLSAMQAASGSDASGYRNLVGRVVVGAWTWLPELSMGIGAEEELDRVLASFQPLRSGFWFLWSVPAVLAGALYFTFGRFRGPRSEDRECIGFYVVERPIGQGGMGDVFLATHRILSRPAALKILREARPDEATISRFKREARMASRLGHPNSIQIFDYGETPDGRLYYAMEYVEGLNLAQLLTLEGTLSVGRSVYLLRQISGALEEAHALGLLHRDLKPSNIMIGRKGGLGDVVKILDFGIASSVGGAGEDATRSSNVVGTPAYMAPERIRQPHQLDFRSDIYSFGGVAFHMLTGRSIFEGPGPTELIYQVLTSKRPSPSKLRGAPLPDALERLILDCLAIEPESRPLSMTEITEALRAVVAAEPWSQDEARAWWASNRERVARFKGASL